MVRRYDNTGHHFHKLYSPKLTYFIIRSSAKSLILIIRALVSQCCHKRERECHFRECEQILTMRANQEQEARIFNI